MSFYCVLLSFRPYCPRHHPGAELFQQRADSRVTLDRALGGFLALVARACLFLRRRFARRLSNAQAQFKRAAIIIFKRALEFSFTFLVVKLGAGLVQHYAQRAAGFRFEHGMTCKLAQQTGESETDNDFTPAV